MAAGVYLHIPFCKSRCSYCDFATDIYRSSEVVDRYVAALCKEIEAFEHTGGNPSGSEGARGRGSNYVAPKGAQESVWDGLPQVPLRSTCS